MINRILHLLTNRASDFGSSIFPAVSDFVPHEEDPKEKAFRDFLHLRNGDSPFYLMGMLAAIYSFPEIVEEFGESDSTFSLSDYVRETDIIEGGSLQSKYGKTASLQRRATEFPVDFDIRITYHSTNNVRIRAADQDVSVPFETRVDGSLVFPWPDFTGVGGVLTPASLPWNVGSSVIIRHEPVMFPYEALHDRVLASPDLMEMLISASLLKHVYAAQTPLESTALIGLAIARPDLHVT